MTRTDTEVGQRDDLNLPGATQFWGTLADGLDPTLHGKLSYKNDLFVVTRTESPGSSSFTNHRAPYVSTTLPDERTHR